jgi:ABC-type uncharacterized transport system substrate-binding protein
MKTIIGKVFFLALSALLFACASAEAQQTKKVPRIGFLSPGFSSTISAGGRLQAALRKLGYIEGQNIVIEWRFAEGRQERLPNLATDLVRLKVDLIVTAAAPAALAAQNATKTIPIIMASISDPVGLGLVASFARPGGNITGMSNIAMDLGGKRLELLTEVSPKVSRVAVLWVSMSPGSQAQMKETEVAARSLQVQLQPVGVDGPDHFENAFSAVTRASPDALLVLTNPLLGDHRVQITDFAAKNRLPAIYPGTEYVEAGGLMSYSDDAADRYHHVARYVDKILKGTKPADLPVLQPTKFELFINLKTAKQIGLTIPQRVLQRADKVIK